PRRGRRGAAPPCSSTRRRRGGSRGAPRTLPRTPACAAPSSASPSATRPRPRAGPPARGGGRRAGSRACGRRPAAWLWSAPSPSGRVAVAGVEGVAEQAAVERARNLRDAVGHRHARLEAEAGANAIEADLVVAGILVAVDEHRAAAPDAALDVLHHVHLAVVLARPSGVVDRPGDDVGGRLEHTADGPRRVAHVDVGPPEPLAEHLQLAVGPEVARELVHRE